MRLLFCAPLLAAMPGAALAGPVSFDEALTLAQAQAPSLRARALELDARRSAAVAADRLPDPELGLGIDNFPVSGPPAGSFSQDSMTMGRLSISQDVPNLAKRNAREGRALADVTAAEAAGDAEGRRVKVAAALAWIDLAYVERRLVAIDDVLERLRVLAPASSSSVASGTARPAQALEIRQGIAALEDRRSEIEAERARAKAILSRWIGEPDPQARGDAPELAIDAAALRAALDRHPDLGVAAARTRQAEADVAVARAEKRPDWGFDVAYQRRAERYGDMVSAGVKVSLPVFPGKRQDPMIAASTAGAAAALAEREDTRWQLTADLEAGLADHAMHHQQWQRAKEVLLPLARQRLDLETASYGAGRAGLLDVVQAHSMLAEAELQALDREAMVMRDAARLALTYGEEN